MLVPSLKSPSTSEWVGDMERLVMLGGSVADHTHAGLIFFLCSDRMFRAVAYHMAVHEDAGCDLGGWYAGCRSLAR